MRKQICPYCDEEKAAFLLEGDSCTDCAMDAELDEMLMAAARRSEWLGIPSERFLELCEAVIDVAGLPEDFLKEKPSPTIQ